MKSRLVHSFRVLGQRLPRGLSSDNSRAIFCAAPVGPNPCAYGASRMRLALSGVLGALVLSGCYYPYGYYPGYYPYYAGAPVPANAVQRDMPAGSVDYTDSSGQQPTYQGAQQGAASAQATQNDQNYASPQGSPPTYAVAQTPPPVVYAAPPYPVYPAYYPAPVYPAYPAYPAYYGYPGWYGPSVSIGFGFGWGGGGWHGHGGYHH